MAKYRRITISIHALVKRATYNSGSGHVTPCISIHALVKRATHFKKSNELKNGISIHALVKRATYGIINLNDRHHAYFNPRPREEGD